MSTEQERGRFLIMKATLQNLKKNSKEYWEQRCIQLEISIDQTYSSSARSNARELYKVLANK